MFLFYIHLFIFNITFYYFLFSSREKYCFGVIFKWISWWIYILSSLNFCLCVCDRERMREFIFGYFYFYTANSRKKKYGIAFLFISLFSCWISVYSDKLIVRAYSGESNRHRIFGAIIRETYKTRKLIMYKSKKGA